MIVLYQLATPNYWADTVSPLLRNGNGTLSEPGSGNCTSDNGDGLMDVAVYRPSSGTFHARNVLTQQVGDSTCVPMVRLGGPQ